MVFLSVDHNVNIFGDLIYMGQHNHHVTEGEPHLLMHKSILK